MERFCYQLLSRAALPRYQHSGLSVGKVFQKPEDLLHFPALADNVVELMPFP